MTIARKLWVLLAAVFMPAIASATVSSTASTVTFSCTNSTGPFPFTFSMPDVGSLLVIHIVAGSQPGVMTILPTNQWSSVPVNQSYMNGGTVTLVTACPPGDMIILARATEPTQATHFTPYMPALYQNFENGLDQLTTGRQDTFRVSQVHIGQITQIAGPGTASITYTPLGQFLNLNFPPGGGGGGGGGVNPSTIALPNCYYATAGSTCSQSPLTFSSPTTGAVNQLPRVDVRSPTWTASPYNCFNTADPYGVLDSTCAINAAITYQQTVFGTGSTSRSAPMVYLSAGTYKISGPIITANQFDIGGDGPPETRIIQTCTTCNVFTVQQQTGFSPNPQGWGGGGRIHDLAISCATSGTQGAVYNACVGNAMELQSTDFTLDNVTVTNWGGRGIMASNAAEQDYFSRIWLNEVRWPISNGGQANLSINDVYAAGPGQDAVYTWSARSHLGYPLSTGWRPTSDAITAASVDGAGNASVTMTSDDLTHGYAVSFSSPVPPGGWFKLSGITASGLTALNGTYQAINVTGASGSAFTITFKTYNQASQTFWTYDDNDEPLWFCGNNVTCPILTPSATSATNPAGLFQVAVFPPVNAAINTQTVTGASANIRIDETLYSQGIVDGSTGNSWIGIYSEAIGAQSPILSRGFTAGGYRPYTTLTQATNTSGAQTVTVNNASWFPVATGDPGNANSIAQSAIPVTLSPCDYNPYQTGVASACAPGVNTNQQEFTTATFDTQNNLHITTRNEGGGAPAGVAWPIGTLVALTDFTAGNATTTVDMQRFVSNRSGSNAGGFYAPICSDQGANMCGEMIDYYIPNMRTYFPLFRNVQLNVKNWVSNTTGNIDMVNPVLGYECFKDGGTSPVTLDGVSSATAITAGSLGQVQDGPGVANGVARHTLSACVVLTQSNVNGTLELPITVVRDNATRSVFQNSSNTPGSASIESEIKTTAGNAAGFNGSSVGQSNFSGHIFTNNYDIVDENGYEATGTITAWSIPTLSSNAPNTLTLTTTINPGSAYCAVISGLTVGAPFNSGNSCWLIQSSGSSLITVLVPSLALPGNLPLSQTESGTVTVYGPASNFHWQCGTAFSGANCGWDFQYWNGQTWNSQWSLRQGTTAGTGNLDINANTSISGALSTNFPVTSGLLSNLTPNSENYSAGTWSITGGSLTAGQPDPWNPISGTRATLVANTLNSLQVDTYSTTPLSANTTYNVCAWLRGSVGGELVDITIANIFHPSPVHTVLTTSWDYHCGQVTTGSSNLSQVFIIGARGGPSNFYVAGVSTTALGNATAYLPTGPTPSPTPTITFALPSFGTGMVCSGTGGVFSLCSGGSTSITLGSTTIPLGGSTSTVSGLTVNGVTPTTGGSASTFLNGAGSYTAPVVPLSASLTTTSATTDNVTITGMTSSGHCSLGAQNASAATNMATSYISAYTTNQITLTHTATASMIYDFVCTAN